MNTRDLTNKLSNVYLFKGEPKVGKSLAGASFPDQYIFDNDKRIRSIVSYYPDREYEYDQFDSFIDIDNKLDSLLRSCPYKSVMFDGFTTFADIIINNMIYSRPVNPKTTRAGVRMTEIEDFGGEQRAFDIVISKLFKLHFKWDIDVIMTAHVIEVEKALRPGVTIKSRSLLTAGKKVAASLPVRFNEAYHFQINEPIEIGGIPKFEVITHHTGDDWAATTYRIPSVIDITNKRFYDELISLRGIAKTEKEVENPFQAVDNPAAFNTDLTVDEMLKEANKIEKYQKEK